jgi:hexose oxidase
MITDAATGYQKIIVSEKDGRFPSFLQGFNRRWMARHCQAVYLCHTTEGTAEALEEAISLYGSGVKIKSGGHCYEDFVFGEDTRAIIDVTPMSGYGYAEERGYYLESGGTNWSAFQALFRDYGKVLPAGLCYSVGLGGHICGGGYGMLSRLNGLTVDWLTGVEVVVKDDSGRPAYPIYVSADSTNPDEQDLYWAHRGGGGGNFGVITKYYFKDLPPAPATALLTSVAYGWDELTEPILQQLLDYLAQIAKRKDNWRQFAIFSLNHQVCEEIHFTMQTVVLAGEDADDIEERFVRPVLADLKAIAPYHLATTPVTVQQGHLLVHKTETLPYTFYEAVQMLNGSGANQRGKYKSAYMKKGFPPDQVQAIYKWLTTIPAGLTEDDMQESLLQVDTYGGQVNETDPQATAITHRASILKIQYQTYWSTPENDEKHLAWIRGFYADMYQHMGGTPNPNEDPTGTVEGCYYNYPDIDLNGPGNDKEPALRLYFGNNLKKLKQVKQRWDGNGYFVSAQSIS